MSTLDIQRFIAGIGPGHNQVLAGYLAVKSGVKSPEQVNVYSRELAADSVAAGDVVAAFSKAYGLTTSDLAQAVEPSVITIAKNHPQPKYRKLAKYIEATDFREQHLLDGFEDIKPAGDYREGAPIPTSFISDFQHATGQSKRDPARIIISYETLRNQTDWIGTLPQAILNGLYRSEASALFAMIESNPNLADGNPLFYGDNTAVHGSLGYSLGTFFPNVLRLFRNQKTRGTERLVGYEPKYLVVPAEHEIEVRSEVQLSGMAAEIEIIVRADISSFYLLADPETSPAIVRLAISKTPSVWTTSVPNMSRSIAISGDNDFCWVPVSRYGICRISPD
ncbi:MAG: hypothetical protein ACXW1U_17675 [Methylobacter sp.]